MTFESINEVCIKWRDDIDNAIFGEIKEKAIAHGIKTEYVLNKKAIISALEKQIPKKPKVLKVHDISNYKYGECECGEHLCDDEKYCSNCGQKIDWGNTKEKTYLNGTYSREVKVNGNKND